MCCGDGGGGGGDDDDDASPSSDSKQGPGDSETANSESGEHGSDQQPETAAAASSSQAAAAPAQSLPHMSASDDAAVVFQPYCEVCVMLVQLLQLQQRRRDVRSPSPSHSSSSRARALPPATIYSNYLRVPSFPGDGDDAAAAEDVYQYQYPYSQRITPPPHQQIGLCDNLPHNLYVTCVETLESLLRADASLVRWLTTGCLYDAAAAATATRRSFAGSAAGLRQVPTTDDDES